MANQILIKRSSVAAKVPATTDLQLGELAINTNDGKLFFKRNNGTESIIELVSTAGNISGNAATATKLQTARTINGISFDGTANITVADSTKLPLAGGTLTGTVTVAAGDGELRHTFTTTGGTNAGFFGRNTDGGVGMYDWANNRGVWTYTPSSNTLEFFVANLKGNLIGNVTGNVSGTAANVTGTVAIANGGTGATTAAAARTNLGAQAALGFTPVQQGGGTSQGSNKTYIGWASDASGLRLMIDSTDFGSNWPINARNVTSTVAIGNGGTGATTAEAAATNLGVTKVNPTTAKTGDVHVNAGVISMYDGSAWKQVFPAVYA